MSGSRTPPSFHQYPVIGTLADADAHDPDNPALVTVPGHLVRPLVVMLLCIHRATATGKMARGIELQLTGLAAPDSSLILAGISTATTAAESLTRTPAEVLQEVIAEETVEALGMCWEGSDWKEPASEARDTNVPGWTSIRDVEELDDHDHNDPAWMLIPPALVRPVWIWLEALTEPNTTGELCQGIELLLCCLAEPDTRGMVSAIGQINDALGRLMAMAQVMISDDDLIQRGEEEEDADDVIEWDGDADDDDDENGGPETLH